MKLFQSRNLVDACIHGRRYDTLEYLIKDSTKNINKNLHKDKIVIKEKGKPMKYRCSNAAD